MAIINLSRGLVPNLYLWYGTFDGQFSPISINFTYPVIRNVNTKPPCTPEVRGELCDPRCPIDDEVGKGIEDAGNFSSYCRGDGRGTGFCNAQSNLKDLVNEINRKQSITGTNLINTPSRSTLNRYDTSQAYGVLLNLLSNPVVTNDLKINTDRFWSLFGDSRGSSNPCVIDLRNEAFINEC